jgi:hypothetical protein
MTVTGVKNNERFARAGKANVNGNGLKGLIPRALFLGEMRIISPVSFDYCDHSNKLFLLDCSQFKRNRRNISHFAEKKRSWNQALTV